MCKKRGNNLISDSLVNRIVSLRIEIDILGVTLKREEVEGSLVSCLI